jgi:hypothetical protein
MVKFEFYVGCGYTVVAYVLQEWNSYVTRLPYFHLLEAWYQFLILPFNLVVLTCVLLDVKTDEAMELFYFSRFLDYIETINLIRLQARRGFHMHVFHRATVPIFLRLTLQEENRQLMRFVTFLVGTSAALYAVSHSKGTTNVQQTAPTATDPGNLFSWDYLHELTPVQWTQYAIVTTHTIRTSSRTRRFLFGAYTCIFIVVTYQYFHSF